MAKKRFWNRKRAIIALQFVILFVFWLILSGHYVVEYILIGVFSAGLVTFLTNDIFYTLFERVGEDGINPRESLLQVWRFLAYLPWLLSRIIMANVQVAWLVLHPKMPVKPAMLQFRTNMKRNFAQVILANSITLTPGTITVNLENGKYTIHTLSPSLAGELIDATMQNKVGAIFMEEKEPPPSSHWAYTIGELEK